MKAVDCIVVGQGIAGTLLSFELLMAGLTVQVIDAGNPFGASKVASGVINPVTGRRVVETWKINQLLAQSLDTYERISQFLNVPSVAKSVDVLAIHTSAQMKQSYEKRHNEGCRYIADVADLDRFTALFNFPYGAHQINSTVLIDLQTLLSAFRNYLIKQNLLLAESFDWNCLVLTGKAGNKRKAPVCYEKGDLRMEAKWLITAEGVGATHNPYFKQLPFRYNKGEALIIAAPGLPRAHIYKLRYSIVPWGEKDLFWVGSTYQWEFEDALPTSSFKDAVAAFLDKELRLPYQIVDHIASVRPASINRRPFAGFHPDYPQLGILNGLGTKGCSLAPYLATAWKEQLLHGKAFDPEVRLESIRP